MKKANGILLVLITFSLYSNPTGRITQDSPPFFSDDFYTAVATEKMDELYQHVVTTQQPSEPMHDYVITSTNCHSKEQP